MRDEICNFCYKGGFCRGCRITHSCQFNAKILPKMYQDYFDRRIDRDYAGAFRVEGNDFYCMFCEEFCDRAVKCVHCEHDDEAMCTTCAMRHGGLSFDASRRKVPTGRHKIDAGIPFQSRLV